MARRRRHGHGRIVRGRHGKVLHGAARLARIKRLKHRHHR